MRAAPVDGNSAAAAKCRSSMRKANPNAACEAGVVETRGGFAAEMRYVPNAVPNKKARHDGLAVNALPIPAGTGKSPRDLPLLQHGMPVQDQARYLFPRQHLQGLVDTGDGGFSGLDHHHDIVDQRSEGKGVGTCQH